MAEFNFIVQQAIKNVYKKGIERVDPNSLVGKRLEQIPNASVIDYLEQELKPEYMNSQFTWKQILDALNKNLTKSGGSF